METFDSKLGSVRHAHRSPTCADSHVRAVEDALLVVVLSVHILDPVSPLRVRWLLEKCDARDWTPQLDTRTKCKAVDVLLEIFNVFWQRDVIWRR
jgi:hypothetical protein